MSKAGLIASPTRGRFVATDAGRALLATQPVRIDLDLLLKEPEFRDFYKSSALVSEALSGQLDAPQEQALGATPEEQIEAAFRPSSRRSGRNCWSASDKIALASSNS